MNEQERTHWQRFMETGLVSDYLDYRGAAESGAQALRADAEGTCSGAPGEVKEDAADHRRPGDPGAQHG